MRKRPGVADVIVVGLGPAGIIASRVLHDAGLDVVAVQAPAAGKDRAPLASPPPTLRSSSEDVALRQVRPPMGADAIGGSKLLAAVQSYRLDDWSFRQRTDTLRRYGSIPSDAGIVDWPIPISEIASWYDRVEHIMRVAPKPWTTWTGRMRDAAESLGWHPFAAPAAHSADASVLLPSGIEVIRATATSVLQRSTGGVAGVEYVDGDGATRSIASGGVVVAASVLPTVRLLLLSGLTAGGRVGRWFMSHDAFVVHGDFAGEDLGRRFVGPASAVAVSEFEGDRFDHAGLGFLGGSVLQAAMTGEWSEERIAAAAVGLSAMATGGTDAATWAREHHLSIGSVWAQPDQLARAGNFIDLDPVHSDPSGRPVARITYSLGEEDRRRWAFLSKRAAEWLSAAGARTTWQARLEPQPLGAHLYGGARMGDDPESSVVDSYGRFHGVPGLVIVGSSTFPSTGGRGPVETIEALAWRSAACLAENLH